MKRSTFIKSLIAAPAAIAVAAKTEAEPLPLGLNTKKIRIALDRDMLDSRNQWIDVSEAKAKGGYLVPPEWADALKEAMSKYPG